MTCLLALQNHKTHITLNDYTSLNVTRQCKASSPKKLLQESIIYSCKIFPLIGGNILSQIKSWDVSFMDIVLIWIQDYCSRVFINLDNLRNIISIDTGDISVAANITVIIREWVIVSCVYIYLERIWFDGFLLQGPTSNMFYSCLHCCQIKPATSCHNLKSSFKQEAQGP